MFKLAIFIFLLIINLSLIHFIKKKYITKLLLLFVLNFIVLSLAHFYLKKNNYYYIYSIIGKFNPPSDINSNNNAFLEDCIKSGTCKNTENNYNLLPDDLKELGKKSSTDLTCNNSNIVEYPKCKIDNLKNIKNSIDLSIPSIITPNIPDGTLMNGDSPVCKVSDKIGLQLPESNSKIIDVPSYKNIKCCPDNYNKMSNSICCDDSNKTCFQNNCLTEICPTPLLAD